MGAVSRKCCAQGLSRTRSSVETRLSRNAKKNTLHVGMVEDNPTKLRINFRTNSLAGEREVESERS